MTNQPPPPANKKLYASTRIALQGGNLGVQNACPEGRSEERTLPKSFSPNLSGQVTCQDTHDGRKDANGGRRRLLQFPNGSSEVTPGTRDLSAMALGKAGPRLAGDATYKWSIGFACPVAPIQTRIPDYTPTCAGRFGCGSQSRDCSNFGPPPGRGRVLLHRTLPLSPEKAVGLIELACRRRFPVSGAMHRRQVNPKLTHKCGSPGGRWASGVSSWETAAPSKKNHFCLPVVFCSVWMFPSKLSGFSFSHHPGSPFGDPDVWPESDLPPPPGREGNPPQG